MVRPTKRAPRHGPARAGEGEEVSRFPRGSTYRRRGGVAAVGVASLLLAPIVAVTPAAADEPVGPNVVINELDAGGGSADQPYSNKFVELYSASVEPVSLEG